ncbi:MAG: hypothetical protein K2X81_08960 [Candidatus Obscuribacterales bacterium]|nr:hypothetical protein [Candidatus Obscuribacterales bacterium]
MSKPKLTLYVMGSSSRTAQAMKHLVEHLAASNDSIEYSVVDLLLHPEIAEQERIFATPMLVKSEPPPKKKIVGDMANRELIWKRFGISEQVEA